MSEILDIDKEMMREIGCRTSSDHKDIILPNNGAKEQYIQLRLCPSPYCIGWSVLKADVSTFSGYIHVH